MVIVITYFSNKYYLPKAKYFVHYDRVFGGLIMGDMNDPGFRIIDLI